MLDVVVVRSNSKELDCRSCRWPIYFSYRLVEVDRRQGPVAGRYNTRRSIRQQSFVLAVTEIT